MNVELSAITQEKLFEHTMEKLYNWQGKRPYGKKLVFVLPISANHHQLG